MAVGQPLQSSLAKPSFLQSGTLTLETPSHSLHCIPNDHEALERKQKDEGQAQWHLVTCYSNNSCVHSTSQS